MCILCPQTYISYFKKLDSFKKRKKSTITFYTLQVREASTEQSSQVYGEVGTVEAEPGLGSSPTALAPAMLGWSIT